MRLLFVVAALAAAAPVAAVDITLDYTYDTSNFFGSGNPSGAAAGAQARATLESVADFFSDILDDSFSAVSTPAPVRSSVYDTVVNWEWRFLLKNPATGAETVLANQTLAQHEYRIYVGARSFPGITLAEGGTGVPAWNRNLTGSGFLTQSELNAVNATSAAFGSSVETRGGSSTEFSSWGGFLSFDTTGNWHYDHDTAPGSGKNDFRSVALHELVHA